eukprot:scaffold160712_cov28-Attheya_sp.AAC.1
MGCRRGRGRRRCGCGKGWLVRMRWNASRLVIVATCIRIIAVSSVMMKESVEHVGRCFGVGCHGRIEI